MRKFFNLLTLGFHVCKTVMIIPALIMSIKLDNVGKELTLGVAVNKHYINDSY